MARSCAWPTRCAADDEADVAVIAYFILGMAMLAGVILIGRWFITSDPKLVAQVLRWLLVVLGLAALVLLAVSGRLAWAAAAAPVLLGWAWRRWTRGRLNRQAAAAAAGVATGQSSDIETPYLRLSLDHDSGVTTGEVLLGDFAGRSIDSLSMSELTALLAVCRQNDQESARVLEAYLNRIYPDWWARFGESDETNDGQAAAQTGGMDASEAYDILGLAPGCSNKDIVEAHRRLMSALHPDRGGSTYLASKLNQAKDLLLNR